MARADATNPEDAADGVAGVLGPGEPAVADELLDGEEGVDELLLGDSVLVEGPPGDVVGEQGGGEAAGARGDRGRAGAGQGGSIGLGRSGGSGAGQWVCR